MFSPVERCADAAQAAVHLDCIMVLFGPSAKAFSEPKPKPAAKDLRELCASCMRKSLFHRVALISAA